MEERHFPGDYVAVKFIKMRWEVQVVAYPRDPSLPELHAYIRAGIGETNSPDLAIGDEEYRELLESY